MDIKTADIVFYKPKGLIGWVISKVTRSPYSHVAVVVNADTIIEANLFIRCRLARLDYDDNIHHVYRLRDIDDETRRNIVENLLPMLGAKYDYLQIVSLFLRLVFNFKQSVFNKVNKYICSEIIDRAFLLSDVKRKDNKQMLDITPEELFDKYELYRIK